MGGCSTPRHGRFIPGKENRYPLCRRRGGPQGRYGRGRKISPPPGFDPRTVKPVASRYTDWSIPIDGTVPCGQYLFYPAFTTLYEFEPPHCRSSEITHKVAPQPVGLLWTSDQPITETSTWQTHNTHNRQTSMPRRDSNPQSQQASGCRPTP